MIKLALKDLRLFFKDKRSVLLTFAIPIALITLFSFAFGGAGKSEGGSRIPMQVADLDESPASRTLIRSLDSLGTIRLIPQPLEAARSNIRNGDEACVLVIHKGLSDSLSSGKKLPLEL